MPKICIVLPLYNEETRFDSRQLIDFYQEKEEIYFCLVNDGSKDHTLKMLKELGDGHGRIEVIDLQPNRGKAEAVRLGINSMLAHHEFKYLAFLDADFSAPLESIPFMLNASEEASVLLGARIMCLGRNIVRNPFRHYIGRAFATMASEILNLPIYDTQCGAKIFRRDMAEVAFSEPFKTTWLFDLEIIMRIVNKIGWEKFKQTAIEVPLNEWIEKGGSKVKLSYMFRMPFDLLKVRRKYGKVKK